jgi:hypothetical protein
MSVRYWFALDLGVKECIQGVEKERGWRALRGAWYEQEGPQDGT